jgi:signal transduction histidine kinase
MQKIKHFFEVLFNTGVRDEYPLAEKVRIQNLNRLCLSSGLTAWMMIPLLIDSKPAAIGVFAYGVCLMSVYIFHYFRQHFAFRVFITFSLGFLNVMFAAAFEKRMGIEIHFILTFVTTLYNFTDHKMRLFNAFFTAFTFLVAMYMQFYDIHFFPAPRLAPYIFFVNTILGLCFLYFIIVRFRTILQKSQQDIERKNELLEQQKLALENSNNIKDKLFSIIGHDLRAPLVSINGFLSLLEMDYLDAETRKNYIYKLKNAISGSSATLDNLIVWYIQQQKNIIEKQESISLYEVVHTIENAFSILLEHKNVSFSHEITQDIYVYTTPNFLPFILRNLVSNALKFTPKGGSISIHLHKKETELWISVKDTGVGITPENIKRLFHFENNFTSLGTENEKGTGLGLPLCQQFAEKNGSRLWVESELGKGSTFYFSLNMEKIRV